MKKLTSQSATSALVSALVVIFIFVGANLIPQLGGWYSPHLVYRWQTENLLNGDLAMGREASSMFWDAAWGRNSVQQIFGLGVPLIRLPFEAFAKVFGFGGFPDRIVFGITVFLTSWNLVGFFLNRSAEERQGSPAANVIIALLTTILFPPFLSLCGSRFLAYEEAVAYGYLTGVLLLVLSLKCWIAPSRSLFYSLAAISSFTPFLRPTAGVYGLASLIIGSLALRHKKEHGLKVVIYGVGVFTLGLCLLAMSNYVRFGGASEFGHSLAANNIDQMRYATRFEEPYAEQGVLAASGELFGILFCGGAKDVRDAYSPNLFPGQTDGFRWREVYFRTYDRLTAIVVFAVWICAIAKLLRILIKGAKPDLIAITGLWSLLASLPLAAFYLRFPFISSRYLLDFGPAFAACSWAFACKSNAWFGSTALRAPMRFGLIPVIAMCWWATTIAKLPGPKSTVCDWQQISARMKDEVDKQKRNPAQIPQEYSKNSPPEQSNIPFNGSGWHTISGNVDTSVMLFVKDVEFIALQVDKNGTNRLTASDCSQIKAKIGLEALSLEKVIPERSGFLLMFGPPHQVSYRRGVQMLSLAMVPPSELHTGISKLRLINVKWGGNAPSLAEGQ